MNTLQPTKARTHVLTKTKPAVPSSNAATLFTGLIGVAAALSLQSTNQLDVSDVAYQLPSDTSFGDAISEALIETQPLTAIHSVMATYGVFCPTQETEAIENQLRAQYYYMLDDADIIIDDFRAVYVSMLYHPNVNTINGYLNFLDCHGLVDSYEHSVRLGSLQVQWDQQDSTIRVEFSSDGRMLTNTFHITSLGTTVNEILDWGTRFMKPESGIVKYSSNLRRLLTDTIKLPDTKPATLITYHPFLNDSLYQALAKPT